MDNPAKTETEMDAPSPNQPLAGGVPAPARHMTVGAFIASEAFDAAVLEAGRIGVARAVEAEERLKLGQHSAEK